MAVNKVIYNTEDGEQTLIDLTEDTVTAATLAEGATAHSANGETIVGTMPLLELPVPVANGGTGATTAKGAADNLSVPSLIGGTAIPANADLNDYKTVGTYYSNTYKSTSNLVNCPTGSPFTMTVGYGCGDSWYTIQEIVDFKEGVRYFRMGTGSGTWYDWQTSYSTAYKPSADGLSGTMTVAKGGTGRATLTSGYYLVGNGTNAVTLRSKSQVRSDIGAVSVDDYNELLDRIEELSMRIEELENNGGGDDGGDTITFYYEDGDQSYELTADAGMTWAEFIESDYNPSVECGCCGGERKLIQLFEYVSGGGDDGDGEVVGFCCGESPNCFYGNNGSADGIWVCDGEGSPVSMDANIEEEITYYSQYVLIG